MQSTDGMTSVRRAITELETMCRQVEEAHQTQTHDLRERVKELNFLFEFFKLSARSDIGVEDAFREILDLVPLLWQCPDETCARIVFRGREFKTTNFIIETQWKYAAEITVAGEPAGLFEVFYLEERPADYRGVLVWEDQNLVDTVSREIGRFVEGQELRQQLQKYTDDLTTARKAMHDYEIKFAEYASRLKRFKYKADESIGAWNRFIKNVGHEIQSSLTQLNNIASGCLRENASEQQSNELARISSVVGGLKSFLNDATAYADFEAGLFKQQKKEFSLRELVSSATDYFTARAAESGIEMVTFIDPLVPDGVAGDSGRLCQILENLLAYAFGVTTSGEITIRAEIEATPHLLPIFHFRVSHTGRYIAEEKQDTFFTGCAREIASGEYGGIRAALGLAVARQLVELLGGEIWIESPLQSASDSKSGAAIHFTMWLDIQKTQKEPVVDIDIAERSRRKILVVDDNVTNRQMLQALLDNWGWEATLAGSGQEALNRVSAAAGRAEPFPVILLDSHMPGMNGAEVVHQLREDGRLGKTSVIMMSATARPEDGGSGDDSGVAACIKKPIKQMDLYNALARVNQANPDEAPPEDTPETGAAVADRIPDDAAGGKDGGTPVILVASDKVTQMLLNRLLERHHYAVTVQGDSSALVSMVKSKPTAAVIMDMVIPAAAHSEAVRAIREMEKEGGRHIPVVALVSDDADTATRSEAECGIDACIGTSGGYDALFERLAELITAHPMGPEPVQTDTDENFPVFDRQKALAAVDGDSDLLLDVLEVFEEECNKHRIAIEHAVSKKSGQELAEMSRALEVSAARLGAAAVAAAAGRLQQASASGDFAAAAEMCRRLTDAIAGFEREAAAFEKSLAV